MMTVAEHKATLLVGVGVQVNVDVDLAVIRLLFYGLLDRPDRGLVYRTRVEIVPVQILGESVQTIISTIDAVRIEHWNDFKHESVSKHFGLRTIFICEELPDTCENKRSWGLSWVHPA